MTTSDECSQVVFQTDTLSKPEALGDGKLDQLREALQQVSRHRRTVPQRVPSHCGIPGNEAEDKRAELGAAELQKDTALSLSLSLSLSKLYSQCTKRSEMRNAYVGGDVAQLVEHRTVTPLTQVRFPGAARDFSPRVISQCRLSYGVRTPPSICAHVKDPVVHVRVRWIMETLKKKKQHAP